MAKKSSAAVSSKDDPQERMISRNRRARHDYEILDSLTCGIALVGSEVKSIRNNRIIIEDGYARLEGGELWLHNVDIAEYPQANVMNHEPRRPRKLLLKRRELAKFAEKGSQAGHTLVPLDVFFRRGIVKVTIGLAKGRRKFDKREKLKEASAGRAMRGGEASHVTLRLAVRTHSNRVTQLQLATLCVLRSLRSDLRQRPDSNSPIACRTWQRG
ncbi:MAG: SsrA-binding protein SmpB [Planctomycetaceae bacterium]